MAVVQQAVLQAASILSASVPGCNWVVLIGQVYQESEDSQSQCSIFSGKFYKTDNFPRGGAGPLGNDHNLGPDGPASLDISHLSKIRSDCRTVRGFSPRVVSDVPRTFLTSVK